jgi:hypothetical protein
MNLESDKRLNIQLRLDFSSAPTGEARQALRESPLANIIQSQAWTGRRQHGRGRLPSRIYRC